MKPPEPPLTPWADDRGGEVPPLAAAMVSDLRQAAHPLDDAAINRIGARLAGSAGHASVSGPRFPPATIAAVAGAAAVGALISAVALHRNAEAPPVTRPAPLVVVPDPVAPPNIEPPAHAPAEESEVVARRAPGRAGGATDSLASESALLGAAVAAVKRHQPRPALALLDRYHAAFPHGVLAPEASVTRVDALLASGDKTEALALLDRLPLARLPRGEELQLVRGELRASAGRCADALVDFDNLIARGSAGAAALERARHGRAACVGRKQ